MRFRTNKPNGAAHAIPDERSQCAEQGRHAKLSGRMCAGATRLTDPVAEKNFLCRSRQIPCSGRGNFSSKCLEHHSFLPERAAPKPAEFLNSLIISLMQGICPGAERTRKEKKILFCSLFLVTRYSIGAPCRAMAPRIPALPGNSNGFFAK